MTPAYDPRILLVDDEVDICKNLSDILTDLGYRVDCAHDGTSALELVRKNPSDIALLDLKMPGMDGLEFCRKIRARPKTDYTYFILLTANHTGRENLRKAMDAGVDDLLPKPLERETNMMRLRADRSRLEMATTTRQAKRATADGQ